MLTINYKLVMQRPYSMEVIALLRVSGWYIAGIVGEGLRKGNQDADIGEAALNDEVAQALHAGTTTLQ